MKQGKLYDTIIAPVITEKSTRVAEQDNKYVFKVAKTANKKQIKDAIQHIFNVTVTKINVISIPGKVKRFRGIIGKRSGYKKAVVSVAQGQTIDASGGAI